MEVRDLQIHTADACSVMASMRPFAGQCRPVERNLLILLSDTHVDGQGPSHNKSGHRQVAEKAVLRGICYSFGA